MKKSALILFLIFFSLYIFAQKEKKILFETSFNISNTANTKSVTLYALLPQDLEGKQKVEDIICPKQPTDIYEKNGNKYAKFVLESPVEDQIIKIQCIVRIYQCDLKTMEKDKMNNLTPQSLEKYLVNEKYIEKNDELIQERALKLKKDTDLKTIKNIYNFTTKHIKYTKYNPKDVGAKEAFVTKEGDCTEFADLFVALCRACSIPAKHITGYTINWENVPGHSWAEAYIPEIGWVPFDPTPGNYQSFNKLTNRYIYISDTRNNWDIRNHHYYMYTYKGSQPTIKKNIIIKEFKD